MSIDAVEPSPSQINPTFRKPIANAMAIWPFVLTCIFPIILVFVWSGPYSQFGAFGHVDLFRLWPNDKRPPRLEPACAGECHWWTIGGPMTAFLWETNR